MLDSAFKRIKAPAYLLMRQNNKSGVMEILAATDRWENICGDDDLIVMPKAFPSYDSAYAELARRYLSRFTFYIYLCDFCGDIRAAHVDSGGCNEY